MQKNTRKSAVILFNLGGPNSLSEVKPFLFKLFYDRHIINLVNPFRFLLALLISNKRHQKATKIYKQIGGKSPILQETKKQAQKLEQKLNKLSADETFKTFICMRYSFPQAEDIINKVKTYNPDKIILLPLYPQYSTTTTLSSFRNWQAICSKFRFTKPTKFICCYPQSEEFIKAHTHNIYNICKDIKKPFRILFSAHSLPQRIIDKGDPYQFQTKASVNKIIENLENHLHNIDYRICYQSKVGFLKWLTPSTKEEIIQCGKDKKQLIIVPISFISEHSETLVELDIEYKNFAKLHNVPAYYRVPTISTNDHFINALSNLCLRESIKFRNCLSNFSQCTNFSQCFYKTN